MKICSKLFWKAEQCNFSISLLTTIFDFIISVLVTLHFIELAFEKAFVALSKVVRLHSEVSFHA